MTFPSCRPRTNCCARQRNNIFFTSGNLIAIRRSSIHLFHFESFKLPLLPGSRNLGRYWPNQRLPFKSSRDRGCSPIEPGRLLSGPHWKDFYLASPRGISQIYWKTFIFRKWKILLGPKCFMDLDPPLPLHELVPFRFHLGKTDNSSTQRPGGILNKTIALTQFFRTFLIASI